VATIGPQRYLFAASKSNVGDGGLLQRGVMDAGD
jgi:hypothetical protein